ncbi:DUF3800 domain-containing protein [Microbacterium sp. ZW T5_56]|uniref:DUF3800 domain-containing protein n=1 Tax=Microbacterium sp. ZW T5_56 TaxID=3378081 RepID=UPI00385419CD
MHVFIDDSGDPGFDFAGGSTRYLVMAACVFAEPLHIEHAADCIRECAQRNRMRREFKYSKTRDRIRTCFFECTDRATYSVRSIVIDKTRIWSRHLRENPSDLKSYAIKQLLTHNAGTIRQAKVVVDGQDSRPFNMTDRRYFQANVNRDAPGTVRAVEFANSAQSLPVQLADMTAGAIHRFVREDEKHNAAHFEVFRHRTWARAGGSMWRFA